ALTKGPGLGALLRDLVAGKLKALVLVEGGVAEWPREAREALAKLELFVVMDYLSGPLSDMAPVMMPTTVTYESSGIYVNRAGRAQAFVPDRVPGLSVEEMIVDETFPRGPRLAPPESDARPAWWALEMLRERAIGKPTARSLTAIRVALGQENPLWEPLRDVMAGSEGVPLDTSRLRAPEAPAAAFRRGDGLALFRVDRILGTETLSKRSAAIRAMAGPPVALLSPADAERAKINGRVG